MQTLFINIKRLTNKALDKTFVLPFLICAGFVVGSVAIFIQKPILCTITFTLFALYILLSSGKNNLILILCTFIPSPILLTPISLPLSFTSSLFLIYLARVALQYTNKQNLVKTLSDNLAIIIVYIIFATYSLSITIINSGFEHIVSAISFCLYMALPIFVKIDKNSTKVLTSVLNYVILVHLVSLLLALGFLIIDPLRAKFATYFVAPKDGGFEILDDRFYGFCNDPNELSMITMIISSFTFFGYKGSKRRQTIAATTLTMAIIALTVLTQSKSYLICVALLVFLLFIRAAYYRPTVAFTTLFAICALIGLTLTILGIGPVATLLSRFLTPNNFDESFLDTITTKRFSIWLDYLRLLTDAPLYLIFGHGARSMYYLIPKGWPVAHNAIINYVWELGIVGTLIFFLLAAMLLSRPNNVSKANNKWLYFPLLVFIVFSLGLTVTGNLEVPMTIILTMLMSNETYQPKQEIKILKSTWVLKETKLDI